MRRGWHGKTVEIEPPLGFGKGSVTLYELGRGGQARFCSACFSFFRFRLTTAAAWIPPSHPHSNLTRLPAVGPVSRGLQIKSAVHTQIMVQREIQMSVNIAKARDALQVSVQ